MLISPTAVFDEQKFVFKGSNYGVGAVFAKNVDEPQYWHRDRLANDFYQALLKNEGMRSCRCRGLMGRRLFRV
jgi:hypothetical protein